MTPSKSIDAIPTRYAFVRKVMSIFDMSITAANTVYLWAYVAIIVGGVLTVGGSLSLFLAEGIRNKHHDTKLTEAQTSSDIAKADAAKAKGGAAKLEKEAA